MSLKTIKRGFNYSQDGPGNRLVYHLYGCNMRCPWCSNPEGMGVLPHEGGRADYTETGAEAVIAEAESARQLFFDGGGVTFTGGEPTMQFECLQNVLQSLKRRGINTAIETNATSPRLPELFRHLDTLIMDFKHYDEQTHTQATGVSNAVVIENMRNAAQYGLHTLIRTPLINGFNASESDTEGFLRVYNSLSDTKTLYFELLPYHEYGKCKWEALSREYTVSDGFLPEGVLERIEAAYAENGLKIVRT